MSRTAPPSRCPRSGSFGPSSGRTFLGRCRNPGPMASRHAFAACEFGSAKLAKTSIPRCPSLRLSIHQFKDWTHRRPAEWQDFWLTNRGWAHLRLLHCTCHVSKRRSPSAFLTDDMPGLPLRETRTYAGANAFPQTSTPTPCMALMGLCSTRAAFRDPNAIGRGRSMAVLRRYREWLHPLER